MSLLIVGADHGGYQLKEELKKAAAELNWLVKDVGTHGTDPVDYPDIAHKVALEVVATPGSVGLMVDGAGIGSSMAANKVPGIRAAVCNEIYTARNAREHNHANLLCLGSQVVGTGVAREILKIFLATQPGGDRHARRVAKITELEQAYATGGVTPALIERVLKVLLETMQQPAAKPSKERPSAPAKAPAASKFVQPEKPAKTRGRPVLTERDVLNADRNRPLAVAPGTLITPQARDTAKARGLKIVEESR